MNHLCLAFCCNLTFLSGVLTSHLTMLFFHQEHDEPILKHLKDIQVKFSEPGQPMVSVHMV